MWWFRRQRHAVSSAHQSLFARLVVALVLLGGPVACGFHLRGEAHYAFETLYLRVRDSVGNEWLPTAELLVRRTYTYNDTAALAKEAQEQRLWREMQDDAVAQIVRRLQSAKKPA